MTVDAVSYSAERTESRSLKPEHNERRKSECSAFLRTRITISHHIDTASGPTRRSQYMIDQQFRRCDQHICLAEHNQDVRK